ncbi:FkbM family methyltransferase [Methylocystis sp. JR02]|uniref:FkbM family methyltransferase n=1 Tax=Methylocystis sp. JR02 TaxID=3046284 RepID=UPI0024BA3511|nr:FkbM family methyltransferase [Methylocystis sp. JR02]MDJ0450226.1 FkbM family methyltransferase [Methylocystis sp. JR02]
MASVEIRAAGRKLAITGPIQSYLDGYKDYDADASAVSQIFKQLPEKTTFIDAGANVGFVSIPLAASRPDLNIICIEPVPHNVEALRANVATNGLDNITVIHAAVSDAPGAVSMTSEGPWSTVTANGSVKVDCITLDQFAELNISGIKIDVEGHEPYVLAGAGCVLSKRPLAYMEFNLWHLIMRHYDTMTFIETIWERSDIVSMVCGETILPPSPNGPEFLFTNIVQHDGLTDLVFRPRGTFGTLLDMVGQHFNRE